MLDQTDREIITLLSKNARSQWREIGDAVHLTGQGVKNRVDRLEKDGVIQSYTITTNPYKMGLFCEAFVTVFMKTTEHQAFLHHLAQCASVSEVYRIGGEGCYLIKVLAADQRELTALLDEILQYANYRVNMTIDRIK